MVWLVGVSSQLNDDQGLLEIGEVKTKRYYVYTNYTKFVRPGMVRYSLTGPPPANVSVSAFKDPVTNNVVLVAINNQASTSSLTVNLDPTSKCQVATQWLTDSGSHNLSQQSLIPIGAAKAVVATLVANSVTTFMCFGS